MTHLVPVSRSWKAKRAAMSILGVAVTINQQSSGKPRWVAEMRLPGGTVLRGTGESYGLYGDNLAAPPYMSTTSPNTGRHRRRSEGAAEWLVPGLRCRYPDQLVLVVAGVEIEMGKELGLR
jgi:hypothetical protein